MKSCCFLFPCSNKKQSKARHGFCSRERFPPKRINHDDSFQIETKAVSEKEPQRSSCHNTLKSTRDDSINASETQVTSFNKTKLTNSRRVVEQESEKVLEGTLLKLSQIFEKLPNDALIYEITTITNDFLNIDDKNRRYLEALYLERLCDCPNSAGMYLVSGEWISRYLNYLSGISNMAPSVIYNDDIFQGIINNDTKIFKVNRFVWYFLIMMYQGGPEVRLMDDEGLTNPIIPFFFDLRNQKLSRPNIIQTVVSLKVIKDAAPKKRKQMENDFLIKNGGNYSHRLYMVDKLWFNVYQRYLRVAEEVPPGPLKNDKLIDKISKKMLRPQDFLQINEDVWFFLVSVYSAGPEIPIEPTDIGEYILDFSENSASITKEIIKNNEVSNLKALSSLSRTLLDLEPAEPQTEIMLNDDYKFMQ